MQVKHRRISAAYRDGADRTCQKWLANFPAGDFSLDDAPWWLDQLKLITVKSRHQLRTINVILRGR